MKTITSKQKLSEWYKGDDNDKLDTSTLKQLYRRISNYVVVKKDKIYLHNLLFLWVYFGAFNALDNEHYEHGRAWLNIQSWHCDKCVLGAFDCASFVGWKIY